MKRKGTIKKKKQKEGMKMKIIKRTTILVVLLLIYIYVAFITLFPDSIVLMQGEKFSIFPLWGMNLKETNHISSEGYLLQQGQAKVVASTPEEEKNNETIVDTTGKMNLTFSLFNSIPVKEVSVSVLPKTKVVPLRKCYRFKIIYQWSISSRNDRNRGSKTI